MQTSYIFAAVILAIGAALLVSVGSAPIEEEVPEDAQCTTDSECIPAGCSGQVCAPAEAAKDIITTCEYRPEYACLRSNANCGCVNFKCAWAQDSRYAECVERQTANTEPIF